MMVMNLVSDIEGCENSFQLQHTFDRSEVLAAELSLQWCDIVPPGMQFLAFWKKMKMLWPFGKSGTGHPMTQCNITEELNPQVHVFLNCNICDSRHCKMYSCFNELQAMYGDYVPLSLYGTITCMGGVAALYLAADGPSSCFPFEVIAWETVRGMSIVLSWLYHLLDTYT